MEHLVISYLLGVLVLMTTRRITSNISLGVRCFMGEEEVFRPYLSANKYRVWIL